MLSTPVLATWRVAESAHFRVFGEMSVEQLRKRVELLEDYRNLLGMFTTAKVDDAAPKLTVYLVDRISDAVPFGKIGGDVAGFYSASDGGIVAYAMKGDFGQSTLLHEYAHHHMFAGTGQSYPAWYVEGFAEYFMTAIFYPTRVDFGLVERGRVYALSMPWLNWDRVIDRNNRRMSSDETSLFYAQSWLLTHYLFRAPQARGKLNAYLKAVTAGENPLAAFKVHVEPDLSNLNRTLRAYTSGRSFTFSRLDRKAPEPVAVTVRDLPASADDLLLMMAMLDTRGGALADRKAALARVQAAAARHPGDALATRTLAMAELFLGDAATAVTLLDGLLAATPADADLLRLKAQALLRIDSATNRGEARRLLVRAVKAAPDDWRAMHVYIHTYDIVHADLVNSVFDVVQLMAGLAPQVDGVTIDFATVLVRRNRFADAAKVLEPLAYAPHGGRIASWAILLRDAAMANDGKRFVDLLDQGPPKDEPTPAAPK